MRSLSTMCGGVRCFCIPSLKANLRVTSMLFVRSGGLVSQVAAM